MTLPLLERIKTFQELWRLIIPHVPPPDGVTWHTWIRMYSDRLIERGVERTAQKFRSDKTPNPDPQTVYRYCGGVIRNLLETQKEAA